MTKKEVKPSIASVNGLCDIKGPIVDGCSSSKSIGRAMSRKPESVLFSESPYSAASTRAAAACFLSSSRSAFSRLR
jgi:hypothetical protein